MIVVGTAFGREEWATDCLASLPDDVPRMVVSQYPWELGKLRWVLDHTDVERFWLLQDSVIVHDAAFLRDGLAAQGAVALTSDPVPFGMFMGVYDRATLEAVGLPVVRDKAHAIALEIQWTRAYCAASGNVTVMFPDLTDANALGIEPRHGRTNLVLRNDSLTKYKGTWS